MDLHCAIPNERFIKERFRISDEPMDVYPVCWRLKGSRSFWNLSRRRHSFLGTIAGTAHALWLRREKNLNWVLMLLKQREKTSGAEPTPD